MILRMGDAVTPSNLPAGLDAVAGYVGGNWPDYSALVTLFPSLKHLSIAVNASEAADCLDIEAGDATNIQVLGWLGRWKGSGNTPKPVLYANAANVQAVINVAGNRADYFIWSAHWTSSPHICAPSVCGFPQADMTQWTDHGGAWDESQVQSYVFTPADPPPEVLMPLPASALPVAPQVSTAVRGDVLDVFVVGHDGHPYHLVWNGTAWQSWEDLSKVG